MAPRYEIYIRDRHLNRVGVVTHFSKLEMKMNFNDAGGWTLDMPDNNISDTNIMKEVFADPHNSGLSGIIVVRDGEVIFSGPIRGFEASGEYNSEFEQRSIQFFGMDDTGLLGSRLCYVPGPSPATNYIAPSNTGWGYDVFPAMGMDPAEDVMVHLVDVNIGPNAETDGTYGSRRISVINVPASDGRGIAMSPLKSRYQNLLEQLRYCANIGELGFKIIQRQDGQTNFEIYEPEDLTNTVKFSLGFGNLGGYRYRVEGPTVNFVNVGGQNTDANDPLTRFFEHAGDDGVPQLPDSTKGKYGIWEKFLDRRDTNDPDELNQAMYEDMYENTEVAEVEAKVINIPPTIYGVDYNIGDKVSVIIDNSAIQDIVRSVTITLTKENGEVVEPLIGTSGSPTTFRLYDQVTSVNKRVGNLEKNF